MKRYPVFKNEETQLCLLDYLCFSRIHFQQPWDWHPGLPASCQFRLVSAFQIPPAFLAS